MVAVGARRNEAAVVVAVVTCACAAVVAARQSGGRPCVLPALGVAHLAAPVQGACASACPAAAQPSSPEHSSVAERSSTQGWY
jgi:hypothetical protein